MLTQAIGVQSKGAQKAPPSNNMSKELATMLLALLKLLTEFDGSLSQYHKLGTVKNGVGVLDETLQASMKKLKNEVTSPKKNTLKKVMKELKKIEEIFHELKGLAIVLMALSSSKTTSTNEGVSSLLKGNSSSPLDEILDSSLTKALRDPL